MQMILNFFFPFHGASAAANFASRSTHFLNVLCNRFLSWFVQNFHSEYDTIR